MREGISFLSTVANKSSLRLLEAFYIRSVVKQVLRHRCTLRPGSAAYNPPNEHTGLLYVLIGIVRRLFDMFFCKATLSFCKVFAFQMFSVAHMIPRSEQILVDLVSAVRFNGKSTVSS